MNWVKRGSVQMKPMPGTLPATANNYLGRQEFLKWVSRGGMKVIEIPTSEYLSIAGYLDKYADQDLDFTDAALIWLADSLKERRILTVDKTDF